MYGASISLCLPCTMSLLGRTRLQSWNARAATRVRFIAYELMILGWNGDPLAKRYCVWIIASPKSLKELMVLECKGGPLALPGDSVERH